MSQSAIAILGERLNRYASLPYEQAWSMPRTFYTDAGMLALEREHLFRKEWVCIGRVEELARPGDFLAVQICDEPILVIHGEDGETRAFSNVCRHRGALIADGSGNRRRLVCPYHHWSYDTRGRLVATPGMADRKDFVRAECRLPQFACARWQGFVFVSLAADPPPLAPLLAGLEPLIGPYHMEEMTLKFLADEAWETNWKCLVENFMEGYHLTPLHRETLHPVNPTRLCRHFPPGEGYFGYLAGFSPTLPRSHRGHRDLTDAEVGTCVMIAVPPGLVVGCAGDYSSFLCLQPQTPERVRVKMGLIFCGADWRPEEIGAAVDLFQRTMAEDKAVLCRLMSGLKSRHHEAGPLAPADAEGTVWDFYHYLHRRLGRVLSTAPSRAARKDP